MIANGISLVVFCYNSEKRIEETLMHIARQKFTKKIAWELVVVDNNSTDHTLIATEKAWKTLGCEITFRIISEKKQGLSYARLAGIKAAAFEIVAFVDDDNRLFENWVETAFEFMNDHSEIGLCGGQTFPQYELIPEPWFEQVKHTIAVGEQGKGIEDITDKRKFVWGAGAVIKKSLIIKAIELGFSNITSSRVPNFLGGGDDWELACIIRAMNKKIYYNDQLKLYHYIPASRITWGYIKKNARGYGHSSLLFDVYEWFIQGKYLQLPVFWLWVRQIGSFIKPLLKYGVVLFFINLFPKGSSFAMKLEYVAGRLKAITGTGFTSYAKSISSMKNYFINLQNEKHQVSS
jgi:glycosyltransferase involved in cell wall biosynthesis